MEKQERLDRLRSSNVKDFNTELQGRSFAKQFKWSWQDVKLAVERANLNAEAKQQPKQQPAHVTLAKDSAPASSETMNVEERRATREKPLSKWRPLAQVPTSTIETMTLGEHTGQAAEKRRERRDARLGITESVQTGEQPTQVAPPLPPAGVVASIRCADIATGHALEFFRDPAATSRPRASTSRRQKPRTS